MKQYFYIIWFLFCLIENISADPIRIMLLGDSITYDDAYIDHSSLDGSTPRPVSVRNGYRNDLWYLLNDAGYDIDFVGSQKAGDAVKPTFDTDNEGYPGATSIDIANRVYDKLVENQADIILLYIGANDWSDSIYGINRILNNIDNYEQNYYHHVKVFLARIVNRRTHQNWMTSLNQNIKILADQRIANGDDIEVVEMEYSAGINYNTDFQDPTHPNDVGYNKIANAWFNSLVKSSALDNKFTWLAAINYVLFN